MNISPEKIAPPVAFVIIGVIILIVGAAGSVPIGNPPLTIHDPFNIVLSILGILLIITGPILVWRDNAFDKGEQGLVGSQLLHLNLNNGRSPIIICANDDANVDRVIKYIDANTMTKARMIQCTGDMVKRVIEKLIEKNIKVELLLQHPSKALNSYNLEKMALFHHRVKIDFKNSQNLTIRYYEEPASVKAIKLDDKFLQMGWYTYHIRSSTDNSPWLYGHSNSAVTIRADHAEVRDLSTTFDNVFQALWENAITNIDVETEINQARKAF